MNRFALFYIGVMGATAVFAVATLICVHNADFSKFAVITTNLPGFDALNGQLTTVSEVKTVEAPIDSVQIDWTSGDINVSTRSDINFPRFKVSGEVEKTAQNYYQSAAEDGVLKISSEYRPVRSGWVVTSSKLALLKPNLDLSLELPTKVPLAVRIHTANNDVDAAGLYREVIIDTANGNVSLELQKNVKWNIETVTVNGEVNNSFTNVSRAPTARKVKVNTVNGDIVIAPEERPALPPASEDE